MLLDLGMSPNLSLSRDCILPPLIHIDQLMYVYPTGIHY